MLVWLNGAVGSGKTAVGAILARIWPGACFVDGDRLAPSYLPVPDRWHAALEALRRQALRAQRPRIMVVAYPLQRLGHAKVLATCARAGRQLVVINLATPLPIVVRGRGGRLLNAEEQVRTRLMHSEGYHRRRFAQFTFSNVAATPDATARRIYHRVRSEGRAHHAIAGRSWSRILPP